MSQESFRKLASPLPFSKQHHSKLVCYITKEIMDTENPPLVLPNGYVYSTKVLLIFTFLVLQSISKLNTSPFDDISVGRIILLIISLIQCQALEEMASKNNGNITCPRTGLVCNYSEVVKAFIS